MQARLHATGHGNPLMEIPNQFEVSKSHQTPSIKLQEFVCQQSNQTELRRQNMLFITQQSCKAPQIRSTAIEKRISKLNFTFNTLKRKKFAKNHNLNCKSSIKKAFSL
jgi:hypothetical protein